MRCSTTSTPNWSATTAATTSPCWRCACGRTTARPHPAPADRGAVGTGGDRRSTDVANPRILGEHAPAARHPRILADDAPSPAGGPSPTGRPAHGTRGSSAKGRVASAPVTVDPARIRDDRGQRCVSESAPSALGDASHRTGSTVDDVPADLEVRRLHREPRADPNEVSTAAASRQRPRPRCVHGNKHASDHLLRRLPRPCPRPDEHRVPSRRGPPGPRPARGGLRLGLAVVQRNRRVIRRRRRRAPLPRAVAHARVPGDLPEVVVRLQPRAAALHQPGLGLPRPARRPVPVDHRAPIGAPRVPRHPRA